MSKVNCMHCGNNFDTQLLMGELAKCPKCDKSTEVPQTVENLKWQKRIVEQRKTKNNAIKNTDEQPANYKKCPYCAEEIKAEAIKCKHCGSDLNEKNKVIVPPNKERSFVRVYTGTRDEAQRKFIYDAEDMELEGYYPVREDFVEGKWSAGHFILALALSVIIIGLIAFIYMLIVKPKEGRLVVTYEFKGCP